ncbi:MAG: class I SAM-dependent methyltransferase [Candidatus Acidiferrum sp.]|jgi:trans-aconitate methyltransferase
MLSTAKWDAGLYDGKHSFVWKMAAGLVELLEPKAGERILDVGCGTGHLTAQIAACGAVTYGIDQSPEMIRQAREKFPELRFEVMDAREILPGRPSTPSFPTRRCIGSKNRSASSAES